MRIASHIAVQIAALVLTGAAVAVGVAGQTSAALEARSRVEGDARHLERLDRIADVTGHLLLSGDLVLAGGTTYLIPAVEQQAGILEGILDELRGELFHGHEAERDRLGREIDAVRAAVAAAQDVGHEQRDARLQELLFEFDELSRGLTVRIEDLRSNLAEHAQERQMEAEHQVEAARKRTLVCMLVLLVALLVSWRYLEFATAQPIRELAKSAGRACDGERFVASGGGPQEVRELAHGFAALVHGLEEARDGLEATVARRTAELQHALEARATFLANTSHELRTPLNAILGFTDLMADGETSEADRSEFLQHVRSSGRHLLALIENVLDLTKIDAGRMSIERLRFSPSLLLGEVSLMLSGEAVRKGLDFRTVARPELPLEVHGDPTRVRQILVNLVGNAIKFTTEGFVHVELGWTDDVLHAEVVDSGEGIPEEKLESIFEDFEQADASATRRFGGTGLGLAISRRLARLMGGNVTVESVYGEGCRFRVEVRADTVAREDGAAPTEADGPAQAVPCGRRVLLVDDVRTNRLLGRKLLERLGLVVDEAADGAEAVDRVVAAMEERRPYSCVLMDLQMPVLNGFEATARVRELGFDGPVLAVSASVFPEHRAAALQAGCNDFLSKPIHAEELRAVLARRLSLAA